MLKPVLGMLQYGLHARAGFGSRAIRAVDALLTASKPIKAFLMVLIEDFAKGF